MYGALGVFIWGGYLSFGFCLLSLILYLLYYSDLGLVMSFGVLLRCRLLTGNCGF